MSQTYTAYTAAGGVDPEGLDRQIAETYRDVVNAAGRALHFPTGRRLAEALGYPADLLDRLPADAVNSFAGVGCHLGLARLVPGEQVLDLGSGSGMDVFAAAALVGPGGSVTGVDITPEQPVTAERLRRDEHVSFRRARIEQPPFEDGSFDAVISNGVVNLSTDKRRVLAEAARVPRPGGRLPPPTASPRGRSPRAPRARPTSGPPASPGPVRQIFSWRASRPPASSCA